MANFLIYRSSAGSGKTYALVKEYLKLVLPEPEEFKSILAVTFTNKAAEEMRSRILKRLGELADGNGGELERQLSDEGVDVNMKTHAKAALDLILHNYSYFSVCTIDSFFHKIIRSFSKELKMRLGCGIEIEEEEALDKAIDDMFAEIGEEKELTGYLQHFAFYSIDEESGWNIDKEIRKLGKEIFKERYRELRTPALADNRTKMKDIIGGLFKVLDDGDGGLNGLQYSTAAELKRNIFTLGIFRDIQRKLVQYREEKNVILISDVNDLLQSIVRDNPSPFIYDRVGIRYKHFLIDEFQDTSTFQWLNLLPLLINSLAENNSTVLVGDVKQSIFRWRNGNMMLLMENIHKDLAPFRDSFLEKKLSNNYRSRKNIISFNNIFFKQALVQVRTKLKQFDSEIIQKAYEEIEQTASESKDGGYVRVKFFDYVKGDSSAAEEKAGDELLRTVKEVQADGYPLKSITVLVRNNDHGSRVARRLASSGIKVVSAESLLVNSAPQVRFLISLLRWFVNKKDRVAKAEALYQYETYINPPKTRHIELFLNPDKETILEQMTGQEPGLFSRNEFDKLPLYDLAETLIAKFELNLRGNAYLLRFLDGVLEYSVKYNGGLSSFLQWWEKNKKKLSIVVPEEEDAVRVLTVHKAKGLENNIVIIPYANWEMDVRSYDLMWVNAENTPFNNSSAYIVRTVKALTDTHFAAQFSAEKVQTYLDNLNLTYVALTRPVDRLYIIAPFKGDWVYRVCRLIKDVIKSSPDLSSFFNKEENVFEFGERASYSGKEKPGYDKLDLNSFVSSDTAGKALLRKSPMPLKSFRKDKMEDDNIEGNVFHAAMSFIKTAADIDSCMQKLIDKGFIAETSAASLEKLLHEVVEQPGASDWFGAGCEVKTEEDLLMPDGTILRPDRIVFRNSHAIVIDYKTGKEKPEHKKQLALYADALKAAGYERVEKYIFYIKSMKIEEVE